MKNEAFKQKINILENVDLPSWTWPWKRKWKSLSLCDPRDYTVHGILQATILEWVAFPFSRESSQPRDQTQVSHTVGWFFTSWATRTWQYLKDFCEEMGGDMNKSEFFGSGDTVNWNSSPSGRSVSISGSGFSKRPIQDVRSWCRRESVFNSKMALRLSGQQKWGHQWVFRFHIATNL